MRSFPLFNRRALVLPSPPGREVGPTAPAQSSSTPRFTVGYVSALGFLAMVAIGGFIGLSFTLSTHEHYLQLMSLTDNVRSTSVRISSRSTYLKSLLLAEQHAPHLVAEVKEDIQADLTHVRSAMKQLVAVASHPPFGTDVPMNFHAYLYDAPHQLRYKMQRFTDRTEGLLALSPKQAQQTYKLWTPSDAVFAPNGLVMHSFQDALNTTVATLQRTLAHFSLMHKALTAFGLLTLLLEALLIFRPLMARLRHELHESNTARDRLEFLAHHDPVTGLPNKAAFIAELRGHLEASSSSTRLVLVYIRLNNTNLVFDRHGSAGVEAVLSGLARRIEGYFRPDTMTAKLSDTHFAVVPRSDMDAQFVEANADWMLGALNESIPTPGTKLQPSVSLSIIHFSAAQTSIETLIADAELALSSTASGNRPAQAVFSHRMRADFERKIRLARDIERGIHAGEFVPWYQPKVSLTDKTHTSFEALLRWKHPRKGIVGPAEFIDVAEEFGHVAALTRRTLKTVAAQHAKWREAGLNPGPVAVNMPSRLFIDTALLDNLCWDIKRFNANAHCIDVEITECVLFVNDETAICAALERLHQTGARIALDDFGTGYASLSHLVQLDCDEVKLDRSFVRECTTNAANRAVLEAIINIAAKRGKSTVVEGIEDAEQHALLSSLGCTLGQGYWYAKPMSAQNATSYLHQVTSLAVSDEALRQSANQSRGAPSYS